MTERQKKLEAVTDSIYSCITELVHQANELEDLGLEKDGECLRSTADQLERLGIRLLNRKHKRA